MVSPIDPNIVAGLSEQEAIAPQLPARTVKQILSNLGAVWEQFAYTGLVNLITLTRELDRNNST
ncbi:hypothetical protein [Lyngbya aestuarii]|uniref:hypothetical protein n=1 Tax=Lyngbya aestuarii TaxID=118322 RepID=UPI00403E225A